MGTTFRQAEADMRNTNGIALTWQQVYTVGNKGIAYPLHTPYKFRLLPIKRLVRIDATRRQSHDHAHDKRNTRMPPTTKVIEQHVPEQRPFPDIKTMTMMDNADNNTTRGDGDILCTSITLP